MIKVFEAIRKLNLSIENKKEVAHCFDSITNEQKTAFKDAVNLYKGRVNMVYKNKLYDNYVYALNSRLDTGLLMIDYLMINGNFKAREPSSFQIRNE